MIKTINFFFFFLLFCFGYKEELRWGTYKPHTIFSVTEKSQTPITMRFSYLYQSDSQDVFRYYLEDYTEGLVLNYDYHNGLDFNQQSIKEKSITGLDMQSIFLKENIQNEQQSWNALIKKNAKRNTDFESVIFCFSFSLEQFIEGDPSKYIIANQDSNSFSIYEKSSAKKLADIKIRIYKNSQEISISYPKKFITKSDIYKDWDLKTNVYDFLFKNDLSGNSYDSQENNVLMIRIPLESQDDYYIHIFYSEEGSKSSDLPSLMEKFERKQNEIDAKFSSIFPSNNDKCAKASFYNLLGGIAYMRGPIYIKEILGYSEDKPLFTCTPSRTKFRIGYLWDEGFHNMLLSQWDADLSSELLNSWLDTVFLNGYLPREQSRGKEVESFIFLPQSLRDVNPPTIMIPILYMAQLNGGDKMRNSYIQLKEWFFFFVESQKSPHDFLYTWSKIQGIYVYGSGLDDYPRIDSTGAAKFHLDLQIWVIFFSDSLMKLLKIVNSNDSDYERISIINSKSLENLNKFLSPDNVYTDIGENGQFMDHFGYINLYPLFFGLIDVNSNAFEQTLLKIMDPEILWSITGIRSLSQSDIFYRKNDGYWTAPVWINLNYLLLRGLKTYYYNNFLAKKLYNDLRNAIINSICGDWEETGYFWENYDDLNSKGKRSHPFNGWTSLITLILSEKYI